MLTGALNIRRDFEPFTRCFDTSFAMCFELSSAMPGQ